MKEIQHVFSKAFPYNAWEDNNLAIGYVRKEYLSKIGSHIGNKLVKVLVGQRRTGKSYIMRQIIHDLITNHHIHSNNTFYLNKEYLAFEGITNAARLDELFRYYLKKMKPKGKVFIFLDEVQLIEEWEKFVNSYSQEYHNKYEIFITGSNSKLLSGELSTYLSGRFVQFEIFPFSFSEHSEILQTEWSKNNFNKYLTTGGLPELYNLATDELQSNYIDALKNTIMLRDIVRRYNVKDVNLLDELFLFVLANTGRLFSFSSIEKYFKSRSKKVSYDTLATYMMYLADAMIVHEALRIVIKGKQILGGERKFYLNDLAFKNYILGFSPTEIGYNLENYVYMYLRRKGYRVFVGNERQYEVDFVALAPGSTRYFQVAYLINSENATEREFGNLLKIKDNHEKSVISMDDITFSDYKGIKHIQVWDLEKL